jgi:hypothetical protein
MVPIWWERGNLLTLFCLFIVQKQPETADSTARVTKNQSAAAPGHASQESRKWRLLIAFINLRAKPHHWIECRTATSSAERTPHRPPLAAPACTAYKPMHDTHPVAQASAPAMTRRQAVNWWCLVGQWAVCTACACVGVTSCHSRHCPGMCGMHATALCACSRSGQRRITGQQGYQVQGPGWQQPATLPSHPPARLQRLALASAPAHGQHAGHSVRPALPGVGRPRQARGHGQLPRHSLTCR